MALKIRLARGGAKKRPFYRIVVAEATAPRDGRFVERIGSYNPLLEREHKDRIVLDTERAKHWLSVGAQPTDRVVGFLANLGLVAKPERTETPKKSLPKKKAQERTKADQAAAEAAVEARAAAVAQAKADAEAAKAAEAQAKIDAEEAAKAAAAEPVVIETEEQVAEIPVEIAPESPADSDSAA